MTSQLTQLFSDENTAKDAFDEAILEVGPDNVRMFTALTVRISDLRPGAAAPTAFRRDGDPIYVVQTDRV